MSALVDRFFEDGNDIDLAEVRGASKEALEGWLDLWDRGQGPAFLPRRDGARLSWYGLAAGRAGRRELEGLLRHWLGSSYTDLETRGGLLDHGDPFDLAIEQELPGRVIRFEVWPPGDEAARTTVRDRLRRLTDMLDVRPERLRFASQRLSAIIDEMILAAQVHDRLGAEAALRSISDARLLDETNWLFLQMRLHAALGDWPELLSPLLLQRLLNLRLPAGVARLVAQAAYEVHLRAADESGTSLHNMRDALPPEVRDIVRQAGIPKERADTVVQALTLGDEPDVASRLAAVLEDQGLLDLLVADRPPEEVAAEAVAVYDPAPAVTEVNVEITPAAATLDDFWRAVNTMDNIRVLRLADELVSELNPRALHECVYAAIALADEHSARRVIDLIRTIHGDAAHVPWPRPDVEPHVRTLLNRAEGGGPKSWDEWLQVAMAGEVPPSNDDEIDWTPAPADGLLDRLAEVDPEVLAPVIGRFMSAHRGTLPPSERADFADYLLLAIHDAKLNTKVVRVAILSLLGDILDAEGAVPIETTVQRLTSLLDDHLGPGTVDWAVDLLGELTEGTSGTDRGYVQALANDLAGRLMRFRTNVSRSTYEQLADAMDTLESVAPDLWQGASEPTQVALPYEHLRGQRILIHSLQERAARRAAAVLRRLGGGTEVVLSHDHDGSPRLRGQVEGADVVIVVTGASKHAATGFIEAAAHSTRLVRTHAIGASSILGALDSAHHVHPGIGWT